MLVSLFILTVINSCAKSEEDKCKNKGWYWNESAKECKETAPQGKGGEVPVSAAETQETCKSKAGYVWNTESSKCKKVDYFMLIHPEDSTIPGVFLALKKRTNISPVQHRYADNGKCIKVPGSYISNLVVQIKSGIIGWDDLCNGLDAEKTNCELGIYEVVSGDDDGVSLQTVALDAERTDCELLALPSE